jgi:transposase
MVIRQGFEYWLKVKGRERNSTLFQAVGCQRFIWNKMLGFQLAQKSGLNRSILDQGWGEFRRQLAYKLEWMGGKLSLVPPHYTSQTCPESHGGCGHVSASNRKDRDTFVCVRCGFTAPADKVGAMNILSLGLRLHGGLSPCESVSFEA